ncbi:MAG: hypothetical protein ACNA7O_08800 [Rhodobacterales bacterium]
MTYETDRNVSDEMLMALADGELTGADASKLMARIKANPALAARYAQFTETSLAMRQVMDPGPVPDHLIRTVLTAPTGRDAPEKVTPLRVKPQRSGGGFGWSLALAASVVLSAGMGFYLGGGNLAPAPAGPDMAAVLTGAATGESIRLADGGSARVLGSFDTDLGLCRLIVLQSADGRADRNVACQLPDGGWQTALSVSESGAGAFALASDTAVGTVDGFLDAIGAGAALTPDDEARALGR